MKLNHLGLPVRDVAGSRQFYETYFAFDPATAQTYDDGTVIIRNGDGFDLALHHTAEIGAHQPFLHFGFRLPTADDVLALLDRMRGQDIEIIEHDREDTLVSFKCLDPDGHRVEVYWGAA